MMLFRQHSYPSYNIIVDASSTSCSQVETFPANPEVMLTSLTRHDKQQSIQHNDLIQLRESPAAPIFCCFPIPEEHESRIAWHLRLFLEIHKITVDKSWPITHREAAYTYIHICFVGKVILLQKKTINFMILASNFSATAPSSVASSFASTIFDSFSAKMPAALAYSGARAETEIR